MKREEKERNEKKEVNKKEEDIFLCPLFPSYRLIFKKRTKERNIKSQPVLLRFYRYAL